MLLLCSDWTMEVEQTSSDSSALRTHKQRVLLQLIAFKDEPRTEANLLIVSCRCCCCYFCCCCVGDTKRQRETKGDNGEQEGDKHEKNTKQGAMKKQRNRKADKGTLS